MDSEAGAGHEKDAAGGFGEDLDEVGGGGMVGKTQEEVFGEEVGEAISGAGRDGV